MAYLAEQGQNFRHIVSDAMTYEVHIYHEETPQTGEFEVFVGVEVSQLEGMPLEMSAKILPPATYAVFSLEGEQIASDWPLLITSQWLPEAGYQADHSHGIQRYDERFKGVQRIDESVLDVYIPLARCGCSALQSDLPLSRLAGTREPQMTDLVSIARAVDYVEECLRQPITVADMAGSASYSVYHQASYVGLQYYPERWKVVGVLYVAGIETCDPSSLGAGTIVKTVPARGNASFVHLGSGDELGLTLDYVYHSWWPRSGTGRDRQGRP